MQLYILCSTNGNLYPRVDTNRIEPIGRKEKKNQKTIEGEYRYHAPCNTWHQHSPGTRPRGGNVRRLVYVCACECVRVRVCARVCVLVISFLVCPQPAYTAHNRCTYVCCAQPLSLFSMAVGRKKKTTKKQIHHLQALLL